MHNNYYFLKQLSAALTPRLQNAELVECFSQNKNEVIFGFSGQEDLYIKASLSPSFCCLSFPNEFSRARRNSVDLFQVIIGKKVSDIKMYENERCFALIFEDDDHLLFKMHGNRSNIILFQNNDITEVFKKGLKNDFNLTLDELDRPLDQSKDNFIAENGDIKTLFPTFGPLIKDYLKNKSYQEKDIEEKWEIIQSVLKELNEGIFHLTELDESLQFSLLKLGDIKASYQNPIDAVTQFFIKYISEESARHIKKQLLGGLEKSIRQTEGYIKKTGDKLKGIENQQNYSQLADIIMANLHNIAPHSTETTLDNFYADYAPITIKLKRDLSPQKNAENYYRKAKNQAIEIKSLKKNISDKDDFLLELMMKKEEIEQTEDFRQLKSFVKDKNKEEEEKTSHKPFYQFKVNNYDVWVGKNAKNNDLLLQQYAYKEDLWLHAKDVTGSHVLIKHQAGKGFPNDVIEKAAQIAAYYSKRKTDTLCPVIVTPRKYVRKRKGDPAGMVAVDKEESVILVPPSNKV
ncbi:NFACT RNA binding domain-containing protein [Fulvivirga ligni]|uniref:NFACT RNA binding domain-containing protein n=1 Tax=Fulvivirga ligni TaxID=2904246 RepID=UPI001F2D77D5|nr:NFACT RNA binding domain-containing protein [Fulvivirga ligni]UII23547.1 NFACT RNA binding domain-containing protein [Fulvivirga ligni]